MPSKPRPVPVVARQEVVFIDVPTAKTVQVSGQPYRVWTLYFETDPNKKPELPIKPVHNTNAFLEDKIHDWNCNSSGVLRYYSRVVDRGVWLLVEYV